MNLIVVFNFLVDWKGFDGQSIQVGFAEVSSLNAENRYDSISPGNNLTHATRKITITLLNDERESVYRWVLFNAKLTAYCSARLDATQCVVAIEELVLMHKGLELE